MNGQSWPAADKYGTETKKLLFSSYMFQAPSDDSDFSEQHFMNFFQVRLSLGLAAEKAPSDDSDFFEQHLYELLSG